MSLSSTSSKLLSLLPQPLLTSLIAAHSRGLLVLPALTIASLSCVPYLSNSLALKLILWISFAICALSLDVVWGRAGIFSFGQTALFGLGGYAYAFVAINVFPLTNETISALLVAGLIGGISAAFLGYFLFYSRLNDVYLSIVTLAVTLILKTVLSSTSGPDFHVGEAYLGGFNGIPSIPGIALPAVFGGHGELGLKPLLTFSVLLISALYFAIARMLEGRLGVIFDGIRSNELRMELLGFDVRRRKLFAFVLGGGIAGIGGGLFAAWGTFINPAIFSLTQAATLVVWVMVGGRGSLLGALIGVVVVQATADAADAIVTEQTPLIVGALLVGMVVAFPAGLVPNLRRLLGLKAQGHRLPRQTADFLEGHRRSAPGKLEVAGLAKRFGGASVLNEVTGAFGDEPVSAIIGPNGAGKSTLFKLLVGHISPDKGRVFLNGKDVSNLPTFERCRRGLGIKMQSPCIFADLTVGQNLELARYGSLNPRPVRYCLDLIELGHLVSTTAGTLSHGQQQWLEIGMLLVQNPSVILLDEPGAGMGDDDKRRTLDLIHRLSTNHTVIVVEHDMALIRALRCPVLLLYAGVIFKSGGFDELVTDDEVIDIYLGRRRRVAA